MKHKTSELEGALLDAAVALADGRVEGTSLWFRLEAGVSVPYMDRDRYDRWWPSTSWQQAGPIIERERIATIPYDEEMGLEKEAHLVWGAHVGQQDHWIDTSLHYANGSGSTPLIAAMRAYVASIQRASARFRRVRSRVRSRRRRPSAPRSRAPGWAGCRG